jgi:hypothetical protein
MSKHLGDVKSRLFELPTAELKSIAKWLPQLMQLQESDSTLLGEWLAQVLSARQSLDALLPRQQGTAVCLKHQCGECSGECGRNPFEHESGWARPAHLPPFSTLALCN